MTNNNTYTNGTIVNGINIGLTSQEWHRHAQAQRLNHTEQLAEALDLGFYVDPRQCFTVHEYTYLAEEYGYDFASGSYIDARCVLDIFAEDVPGNSADTTVIEETEESQEADMTDMNTAVVTEDVAAKTVLETEETENEETEMTNNMTTVTADDVPAYRPTFNTTYDAEALPTMSVDDALSLEMPTEHIMFVRHDAPAPEGRSRVPVSELAAKTLGRAAALVPLTDRVEYLNIIDPFTNDWAEAIALYRLDGQVRIIADVPDALGVLGWRVVEVEPVRIVNGGMAYRIQVGEDGLPVLNKFYAYAEGAIAEENAGLREFCEKNGYAYTERMACASKHEFVADIMMDGTALFMRDNDNGYYARLANDAYQQQMAAAHHVSNKAVFDAQVADRRRQSQQA